MAIRTQRLLLGVAVVLSSMFQAGCSGLFFYPDHNVYLTPDRLELEYEDIYLDTADGERLHGWWLPAQGPGSPRGNVYFLHGNAQNISSHILNVAWLPKQGYNIFMLDYRGYGQSSGEPDLDGALLDVETGMRWLAEKHSSAPLYLLGQSLGGSFAVMLASEWTQRGETPVLTAVVVDSSFSGFRSIAREKLGAFWLTWALQVPLSWTIPARFEATDHIASISPVPVMVIHSKRDGIIPFHHGQELYEAASSPKRFLETDTAHGGTYVIPAFREALVDFFESARDGDLGALPEP